ncbi:MAG: hypothetical protein ACP59X_15515 [Solidesulfovibrio sp. DCME]|uniref:hypothetical protein n=1 Tax=Solidesulfovibrio sp. DCME TaxID=3447380 RepID=UPI003D0AFACC
MSRRNPFLAALPALICLAALGLARPEATALAGVVVIENDAYSLDGGRPMTGAWEVAEKIAVARDTAVVVLGKNSKPATVQTLLQLLENLHVPTLFTKKADYKALLDRGVIKPSRTPANP